MLATLTTAWEKHCEASDHRVLACAVATYRGAGHCGWSLTAPALQRRKPQTADHLLRTKTRGLSFERYAVGPRHPHLPSRPSGDRVGRRPSGGDPRLLDHLTQPENAGDAFAAAFALRRHSHDSDERLTCRSEVVTISNGPHVRQCRPVKFQLGLIHERSGFLGEGRATAA